MAYDQIANGAAYYITGIGTTNDNAPCQDNMANGDGFDQGVKFAFDDLDGFISADTGTDALDADVISFSRGVAEARVWISQLVGKPDHGAYTAGGKTRCLNLRFAGFRDAMPHVGYATARRQPRRRHHDAAKYPAQANALNEHSSVRTNIDVRSILVGPTSNSSSTRIEKAYSMNRSEGVACRLTFPLRISIVGLLCSISGALATPVMLPDASAYVVDLGEAKAREFGSDLAWVRSKHEEVRGHLQRYWSSPCDEAMMFIEPAMHAGELMLTVACKREVRIQLERSVPERQQREQSEVRAAAWDHFVERVTQWTVSGSAPELDPEIETTLRASDRKFLDSFWPLLAIYRDDRWFVLPMRVWETADIPRLQRTRWQEAMIDLMDRDRKEIDKQEAR